MVLENRSGRDWRGGDLGTPGLGGQGTVHVLVAGEMKRLRKLMVQTDGTCRWADDARSVAVPQGEDEADERDFDHAFGAHNRAMAWDGILLFFPAGETVEAASLVRLVRRLREIQRIGDLIHVTIDADAPHGMLDELARHADRVQLISRADRSDALAATHQPSVPTAGAGERLQRRRLALRHRIAQMRQIWAAQNAQRTGSEPRDDEMPPWIGREGERPTGPPAAFEASPGREDSSRIDLKTSWAKRHPECFPIDLNRASVSELLQIPGLGLRGAHKIVQARRHQPLQLTDLRGLKLSWRRIAPYVTAASKSTSEQDAGPEQLTLFEER